MSEREVIIKHFLESLSPLLLLNLEEGLKWVDVGTGAGFPGLVLKIARPQISMTLLEATGKKVAFLHHIVGSLGLSGVSIINDRIGERNAHQWSGSFDLLTTRAVSPRVIFKEVYRIVRPGGKILLFQGQEETIQTALQGMKSISIERILPVNGPHFKKTFSLVLLKT